MDRVTFLFPHCCWQCGKAIFEDDQYVMRYSRSGKSVYLFHVWCYEESFAHPLAGEGGEE